MQCITLIYCRLIVTLYNVNPEQNPYSFLSQGIFLTPGIALCVTTFFRSHLYRMLTFADKRVRDRVNFPRTNYNIM